MNLRQGIASSHGKEMLQVSGRRGRSFIFGDRFSRYLHFNLQA